MYIARETHKLDSWKGRGGKSQRREEQNSEDRWRERVRRKKNAGAQKGSKLAKHCVFGMICGSGGSKSRLAKAAGAEPSGQMRDGTLHVVAVRSTLPSQNAQSTTCLRRFCVAGARDSAPSQSKQTCFFLAKSITTYITLHCTSLHYATQH